MTTTLPDQGNEPNSLGALLIEHRQQNPGVPLLALKKGLALSGAMETAIYQLLTKAQAEHGGPIVLTALSNAGAGLNPYSGLAGTETSRPDPELLEGLVQLLAPGRLLEWNIWPGHLALFSAEAVELLAVPGMTEDKALSRLRAAGGQLLLADSIFLFDSASDLFFAKPLEPHESRRPAAWGQLRQRLAHWLEPGADANRANWAKSVSDFRRAEQPVTLHITHSWGGGIANWVESFIGAERDGINLQLRSEEPESGEGYGQRFSLYLGNQLNAAIATWWVQPPIRSTAAKHDQYRDVLLEVLARFGVGRLIISSLVGHSLDALATGLPTVEVLHDYYPLWPLLGIHPEPYLSHGTEHALKAALREHRLLPGFRDRDAEGWIALGIQWREAIAAHNVNVIAPSRSVAHLFARLDPAWESIETRIVPHGLPELPGQTAVDPRPREDGRLRLVIPGRIQDGKGRQLLLQALPELTEFAQVYLLGAGKEGEAFFGIPGVDVIVQYRREDLHQLLTTIGPHVAGLLSVVPETFSYTLSEMQQLNIPVIATRVGSLEERITDGKTGWLISADPKALVERVRSLAGDPADLRNVRDHLKMLELPGTGQMAAKYREICAPRTSARSLAGSQDLGSAQAAALAFQNTDLTASNRALALQSKSLQTEVEKRTEWAEARERERKIEVERRIRWVSELEGRLQRTEGVLQRTEAALEHEQTAHRQTNLRLENVESVHEWVLGTASWRFTRPFRVLGRLLKNAGRARAWNPLRWPLLLSQAIRTVSTQGFGGALERSQATRTQPYRPEIIDSGSVETVGDPTPPAGFEDSGDPDVSIVIPVYNKWAYTAACLRSLAETENRARFEVIVVDDQSSDETAERLDGIQGLINLRNEHNLGFVGSSNRGAEAARGRYIVMLNNDTQVTDGWLDALVDTFERHPDTGIAGAVLVYPDGTLQEAGGIIFNDGSGWNYGKGDSQARPEYQYIREADYCSGACIMLKTALFRELGGFDSHYAPAYYEDTDLGFRVRAQGLKVRVQPAATIVHHEGITSGTDLNAGTKRYQEVNREKFMQRWRQQLATHPGPVNDPGNAVEIRRARDHRLSGRILVIDAYTPEPDQDSGSVRLCYLMDCMMKLGYGVTFMADNRTHAGRYTTELQQAGIEVVYDPWLDSLQRFFSERGSEFDFVMISRHYVASKYESLLRRHCPDAKFIFDTVDLHYLREERMAELEDSLPLRRSAAQTRRSELSVIDSADATIVVSPVEKTVLEEAAPEARVHVISNIHEVVGSQRPFAERKDIFFVGGYQHPPNVDAAKWFVSKIWPLVHKELPEMEFHLIGSKASEEVRALQGNGVRFHGFVKTLDPWLDGCRLAVAPLRYGAGIKGKVNMSMSRGQPVVATPMAVEGMFAKSGRDVLVAESAEDFAEAVIRLYQDEKLWDKVSIAGLENVRQYFSVETARLGLRALLKSLS
ncbi:MAG: glycosyltransferase [Xanthomonadales bacterium]|nr:glycosyltransferase [Gammaproteobacteria bacterium]NND56682.1 glycosyltransferase [Xanthomonadales bacterium]